jgi:hypothetical protein
MSKDKYVMVDGVILVNDIPFCISVIVEVSTGREAIDEIVAKLNWADIEETKEFSNMSIDRW